MSKILGFPCAFRDLVLRRAIRAVLVRIRARFPRDLERLRLRLVGFRRLPKRERRGGTLGQVTLAPPRVDPRVAEQTDLTRAAFNLFLMDANDPLRFVRLPDPLPRGYDDGDARALVAHELGHVATREEDIKRRGGPCEEWASEATADWYVYRWGYGREQHRTNTRHPRDFAHHGGQPGEHVEIYGQAGRISRALVWVQTKAKRKT